MNGQSTGGLVRKMYTENGTEKVGIVAIDKGQEELDKVQVCARNLEGVEYLGGYTDFSEGINYLCKHEAGLVLVGTELKEVKQGKLKNSLEELVYAPAVAFMSDKTDYAYEAWKAEALDYILKPITEERLRRAVERVKYYRFFQMLEEKKGPCGKNIYIKCFPSFDVFINGKIVQFSYGKVKELLAFLVYQQGNWCSIDQIVVYVLENYDEKTGKEYYRTLMYRLKHKLESYGIRHILETGYGRARINPRYFVCEYYEYLKGRRELFQGTFMGAYGWAGDAAAYMSRQLL